MTQRLYSTKGWIDYECCYCRFNRGLWRSYWRNLQNNDEPCVIPILVGPRICALCLWMITYFKDCYFTFANRTVWKTNSRFRHDNAFHILRRAIVKLPNGILQPCNVI